MKEEFRNQLEEQIKAHDIYTKVYRDRIESCKLFDEYENVRIVDVKHLTMSSKPVQVFIAITDTEFDGGTDFQCFGSNAIILLPRSIYEAMFSDPMLMSSFNLALADRLDELPALKCIGETGIVAFMRRKMG